MSIYSLKRNTWADMKNRQFRKAACVIILVAGIYFFFRINVSHINHLQIENCTKDSEEQTLAPHYKLPSRFMGKILPFHHIYEPRQVGYPTDLQNKHNVYNKTKIILLWTPWNGVQKTINYYFLQLGNKSFLKYNCPNVKCVTTRNRKDLGIADAVLFHLLDTKSSDLPSNRTAHQAWILYNMEPPWLIRKHIYPDLPYLNNIFNWTMSYRSNSDIIARYGFIASSSRSTHFIPFHYKTKSIVWFVSDCTTDSKREDYVNELNKYIDVDIYGKCGNHKCYPSQSDVCYKKVLQQYKFYLSFENAICKDYITEKFFNVFNYDIIPIVFGAANYLSIAPKGTFVDATQYSQPKELASTLYKISSDENLYKDFLFKKSLFKSYLDPWMCRLCDKLHTSTKSSILEDVEKWWLTEAQCQTWNKSRQHFETTA